MFLYARQRQQREQYLSGCGVGGVLIDAGISCRGILAALETREIDRESIGAVFITHEHTDHIKGLKVLLKKLPVRVLCN